MQWRSRLAHFFGPNYLHDLRSSLSWNNRKETSPVALPEGRVLVQSALDDDEGGLNTLLFGENSAGNRNAQQVTWETINTTNFYARGRFGHAIKITSDVRFDGYRTDAPTNALGTFTYASLVDVAEGQPTSFSRTLHSPVRAGGEWNAFASIGDTWRPATGFALMYGARLEGNRFIARPSYNAALDTAFGVRSDYAPATMHVSPRAGFTWFRVPAFGAVKTGPAGSYAIPSRQFLRGGTGEFRSMLSPTLLAEPRVRTGLSNGVARLLCIGDATPTDNWSAFSVNAANIPSECASSTRPTLADAAPNVRVIANGYRPSTSWRANLTYASYFMGADWSLDGIYSLNLHQPGSVDLNFNATPHFTLGDDARPVFAPPSAVIPASGLIATTASRRNDLYARVVSSTSDLRSVSRQVTLNMRPSYTYMNDWFITGSYTLADHRSQTRGFDGATFASPLEKHWGRSDFDVRHQVQSQFGITPAWGDTGRYCKSAIGVRLYTPHCR